MGDWRAAGTHEANGSDGAADGKAATRGASAEHDARGVRSALPDQPAVRSEAVVHGRWESPRRVAWGVGRGAAVVDREAADPAEADQEGRAARLNPGVSAVIPASHALTAARGSGRPVREIGSAPV